MPWPVHPTGFFGARGDSDTYRIERSLRFNSADSAYLNRTPVSSTNDKTATLSLWIKRGSLGSTYYPRLFCAGNNSSTFTSQIGIQGDSLFMNSAGLTSNYTLQSNQVLRDPSSWYHLVYVIDTANATSSERLKMYVNGVQVTSFSTATYPNQNTQTHFNQSYDHSIGASSPSRQLYYDGYITEINWIDGQALTPSSFGETDAITGRWKAKAYSGTYGTNGFYLKFADNSGATATTLGKDSSGNGNNWTPNNFSVTAGAGNDSLVDSPTNYGSDTGVGGEVRGNYCTLNPLNAAHTYSNGNLDIVTSTTSYTSIPSAVGSFGLSSGKWYFEFTPAVLGTNFVVGITSIPSSNGYVGQTGASYGYYSLNGNKITGGVDVSYGASIAVNDVVGIAVDLDAGKIWWSKNGTWQASGNPSSGTNEAYSSIPSGTYFPSLSKDTSGASTVSGTFNFGQRPFAYTAPTGFKALCTQNLTQPTIQKPSTAMDVVTYTGNGGTQTISGLGFSPDLLWTKGRSQTSGNHLLTDSVRGNGKSLMSNTTGSEDTRGATLTSDGFTYVYPNEGGDGNFSAATYVAWSWDAGSTNSTNTSGSITSTVRANPQAGFSILTFGYPVSGPQTIGHGLGIAPSMIIVKSRSLASSWVVYHKGIGNTDYLILDNTNAKAPTVTAWNNTTPTSSVFTIGSGFITTNYGANGVAYCFAEIEGYSKFGSYTGNGSSDGPFVWCGFRPRWVMVKNASAAATVWCIWDTSRDLFNLSTTGLQAQASTGDSSGFDTDIISNGFKIRDSEASLNGSGNTIIFAAFAEAPFKYARAR